MLENIITILGFRSALHLSSVLFSPVADPDRRSTRRFLLVLAKFTKSLTSRTEKESGKEYNYQNEPHRLDYPVTVSCAVIIRDVTQLFSPTNVSEE